MFALSGVSIILIVEEVLVGSWPWNTVGRSSCPFCVFLNMNEKHDKPYKLIR